MTGTRIRDVAHLVTPLILLLLTAVSAPAQQVVPLLPDSVAERMVEAYNRETTTRFAGDARIASGTSIRGDVASLGGTLVIDGSVIGNVYVINGSLDIGAGGSVTGVATVVGGDLRGGSAAGGTFVYREPLRYRDLGGRIAFLPSDEERGLTAGVDLPFGRTDVLIASHGAYNRAEGLPIAVGPRVRLGGSYPVSARALLIARTAVASGLDSNRFGWDVSAEQLVVPSHGVSLGVRLFSEIDPIEDTGLSDREASLAAAILHQDFRDHYEREGWSLFVRYARPGTPLVLGAEYRDEEHVTAPIADPPSLIRNGEPWRDQPSIAEGSLRSVLLTGAWDTRNEQKDPSAGWLIRGSVERGLGGTLANPAGVDPETLQLLIRDSRTRYSTASVDVRRYARLSPYARIGIRATASLTLDGRPLPPQRQHALGGEGSLPGYRTFEFDCGARSVSVPLNAAQYYPYYGCDQVALVQLEYQAGFPFARRLAESAGIGSSVGHLVRWVAFFDAGRAWTESASRNGRLSGGNDFSADAGLGIRVGPLGAYWAMPLSGEGQGFNFFLRIGPRL